MLNFLLYVNNTVGMLSVCLRKNKMTGYVYTFADCTLLFCSHG